MAHRKRNQAVVADDIERELQLFAPEATVANKRALGRPLSTLALVERVVKMSKVLKARIENSLIRAIAGVGVVEQRNVAGFAHEQPEPNDAQVAPFALRVSSLCVVVAMCVSKFVVSNASTSVDNLNSFTVARAS